MAGFIASNVTNALNLPLKNAASQVATEAVQAVSQQVANFVSPSSAKKQAEALSKISTSGIAKDLKNVTPNIVIEQFDDSMIAVYSNGQPIGKVGSVQTSSVPASFVANQNIDKTAEFKVKISQHPSFAKISSVVFDVMPTITESRNATYDPVQLLHHPGEILKYKSTGNRSWSVKATLISRSPAEASKNLEIINLIRSWTMPFYGVGTEENLRQYLGAPPPILTLEAYGGKMVGPVKCIMESYDWSWPNDVDYIPTLDLTPFPVVIEVGVNLKESYSPAEYSSFSLSHYRDGKIPEAFRVRVFAKDTKKEENPPPQVTTPAKIDTSQPTQLTKSPVKEKSPAASISSPSTSIAQSIGIDIGANTLSDHGIMP